MFCGLHICLPSLSLTRVPRRLTVLVSHLPRFERKHLSPASAVWCASHERRRHIQQALARPASGRRQRAHFPFSGRASGSEDCSSSQCDFRKPARLPWRPSCGIGRAPRSLRRTLESQGWEGAARHRPESGRRPCTLSRRTPAPAGIRRRVARTRPPCVTSNRTDEYCTRAVRPAVVFLSTFAVCHDAQGSFDHLERRDVPHAHHNGTFSVDDLVLRRRLARPSLAVRPRRAAPSASMTGPLSTACRRNFSRQASSYVLLPMLTAVHLVSDGSPDDHNGWTSTCMRQPM